RSHDGLVEILNSLDEVAVAHDDIAVFGDHQADGLQVHMPSHYKMKRASTSEGPPAKGTLTEEEVAAPDLRTPERASRRLRVRHAGRASAGIEGRYLSGERRRRPRDARQPCGDPHQAPGTRRARARRDRRSRKAGAHQYRGRVPGAPPRQLCDPA